MVTGQAQAEQYFLCCWEANPSHVHSTLLRAPTFLLCIWDCFYSQAQQGLRGTGQTSCMSAGRENTTQPIASELCLVLSTTPALQLLALRVNESGSEGGVRVAEAGPRGSPSKGPSSEAAHDGCRPGTFHSRHIHFHLLFLGAGTPRFGVLLLVIVLLEQPA